jgi:hypothetical protein
MTEFGHRSGLAQKTFRDIVVGRKLTFDNFDRYWTFETEMRSEIDGSHAARANLALDSEPAGDKLRDIHI